jgi:hypothetical protein
MDGNELFFWLPETEFAKLESEIPELKPNQTLPPN